MGLALVGGPSGIPTGFHLPAQGCGLPATLGKRPRNPINPNGVVSFTGRRVHAYTTPLGLIG